MKDQEKTRDQLIGELRELRMQLAQVQRSETEREHAEAAMYQSQRLLERTFASLRDAVFILDAASVQIIDCNPAASDVFGYSREEMIGRTSSFLHVDEATLEEFRRHLYIAMERHGLLHYLEFRMKRKNGTVFPTEHSVMPLEDDQRKRIGWVSVVRDITERKRMEYDLRQSEERYRRFFEEDLSGDYISTPDGRLLDCNPAFARMLGFGSVEEAIGQNLALLHPTSEARSELLDLLRRQRKLEYIHTELRRMDGSVLHVLENATGTFDDLGELIEIHGYLIDETERRKAEEQLRQAQKMEAVGRLAGGIAHDFNNLLTVILGYSDMLLTDAGNTNCRIPNLMQIKKAAQRASDLTHQLLAFSRKQVLQPVVIDLNTVVEEVANMLRRLIGEDIDVFTLLDPTLGRVKADPRQIEQILMNLAVNSRDAMPKGGRFTIETANVELDQYSVREQPVVVPGHYVVLTVSDNGVGMHDNTKAHLFEPFFTTKEPGKGTGMGLPTVYGIVKQSNGYIWVHSELGRGTTVKIYLPRVKLEPLEEAIERDKVHAESPRGAETVLLVEDEENVRNLILRILEDCGYRVLESSDPQEAMEIARKHQGAIPLLITDVVMPGMSGSELAEGMKSVRPDIQVLYISGYTDEAIAQRVVIKPGIAFLQKPFTRNALTRKVREVLDS
jgi:PAS domain S-box-containing protein